MDVVEAVEPPFRAYIRRASKLANPRVFFRSAPFNGAGVGAMPMPWGRGALFIIYSSHLSNLTIRPLQTPGPLEMEERRRFDLNEGLLTPNRIPSRTPPL